VKRHSLDPFSLVFGTTFTLLGVSFLLTRVDIANLHLRWIWPIPLVVLGGLIIVLSVRGEKPRETEIDEQPYDTHF
jgi:hypothetical protein